MNAQGVLRLLGSSSVKSGDTIGKDANGLPIVIFGSGAFSGTATGWIGINLSGTTTTTVVYVNVNGTWTALTIN